MRVVGVKEFGGPEALEVVELPDPRPQPDQIVILGTAAAVNPTDTGLREGAYGDRLTDRAGDPPYVPGMDVAGVVEMVGDDVERFAVGDRVMAIVDPMRHEGGAYAERVVVPAHSAVAVPDRVSLEQAATLPMNGLTAQMALDMLDLAEDQTLGVTGAAGILGSYVVALGKHRGLRVVADAAEDDLGLVRAFGADHVVARGSDVAEHIRGYVPDGVDGLVDASVQGEEALAAVRDGGGFATVRGWDGENDRDVTIHKVWVWEYMDATDKLQELADLVADGTIELRVAGTYEPEKAGDAHRRLAEGGVRGRLLITF